MDSEIGQSDHTKEESQRLWETKEDSDVIVECDGGTIAAHSSILGRLAERLVVIDYESSPVDSPLTYSIQWFYVDVHVARLCLEYLYLGDYTIEDDDILSMDKLRPSIHALVHQHAIECGMDSLADRSHRLFCEELSYVPIYVTDVLEETIVEIYNSSIKNNRLRDGLATYFRDAIQQRDVCHELWALLEKYPALMTEILKKLMPGPLWFKQFCATCDCPMNVYHQAVCYGCGSSKGLIPGHGPQVQDASYNNDHDDNYDDRYDESYESDERTSYRTM